MIDEGKDEFNEYGVRSNVTKDKIKNSPNYSMIIIVTVLFSIFNFVVGYMIGKFLGNSPKNVPVSYIIQDKKSNNLDDIVGIPSSSNQDNHKDSKNLVDVSDIDNNDISNTTILENQDTTTPQKISKKDKTPESKSIGNTRIGNTRISNTRISNTQKSSKSSSNSTNNSKPSKSERLASTSSSGKNYYIQVSANENKNIAQGTLEKLKTMGIKNVSIVNTTVKGKNVYRVRIGAFNSYEEANKALELAKKINKDAFMVVSSK